MTLRLVALLVLSLALASCGVKNDLVLPDGKPTREGPEGSVQAAACRIGE